LESAHDRGGGKIKESGPCVGNLHGVWDRCIIEQTLGQDARAIGRDLQEAVTDADRMAWQAGQVHDWAAESLVLAREASVHYCVQEGSTCSYDAGRETYQPGSTERVVKVDAAYLDAHKATVIERLKRGGVRLAHLLNKALGQ
jgi:nuclease S1